MRARRRQPRALVLPYLLSSVSSRYNEKRRGFPRRSLRCARKILAEFPREPVGSRFPNQRPFELLVLPERFTPALRRVYAAGRCSRSLSRFAPDFLGESGPFCPICLGPACWLRPLSAFAVFHFQQEHAMGRFPTRIELKCFTLRCCERRRSDADSAIIATVHDRRFTIDDSRFTTQSPLDRIQPLEYLVKLRTLRLHHWHRR